MSGKRKAIQAVFLPSLPSVPFSRCFVVVLLPKKAASRPCPDVVALVVAGHLYKQFASILLLKHCEYFVRCQP